MVQKLDAFQKGAIVNVHSVNHTEISIAGQ